MPSVESFANDPNIRTFRAGEILVSSGDSGTSMFLVLEGEVEIKRGDATLEIVGPGGVFGEMALVEHKTRTAAAVARTGGRLVPIDQQRFLYLVRNTPYFAIEVMQTMADRLRRMDSMV